MIPLDVVLDAAGALCARAGCDLVLPGDPLWFGLGEQYGFGLMATLQNFAEGFTDWASASAKEGGRGAELQTVRGQAPGAGAGEGKGAEPWCPKVAFRRVGSSRVSSAVV